VDQVIGIFQYNVLLGKTAHRSPRIIIGAQEWNSAHLMTVTEIDRCIDVLKEDLEKVRIKSKQILKAGMVSDGTKN
jgi:hypothetical protein